jgi:hexokinase
MHPNAFYANCWQLSKLKNENIIADFNLIIRAEKKPLCKIFSLLSRIDFNLIFDNSEKNPGSGIYFNWLP